VIMLYRPAGLWPAPQHGESRGAAPPDGTGPAGGSGAAPPSPDPSPLGGGVAAAPPDTRPGGAR
jgi:hypothetical protein